MTISDAITRADAIRLNVISDEQKCEWLFRLDGELSEMLEIEPPKNTYPDMTGELLIKHPYDDIYPLYLTAMIDYYNQELQLYQNDRVMFEQARDNAVTYYRRHNRPKQKGNWRVM